VRQSPHHGVARRTLTAAAAAPLVRLDDPARHHGTIRLEPLPHGFEAELVESQNVVRSGQAKPA
jgi:hypothetical protein